MFSCAPTDGAIARALAAEILLALAGQPDRPAVRQTIALLAGTDHESRMTAREIARELSRRGHAPDHRFDLPPHGSDTDGQLAALAAAQPAVVVIAATPEDAARLVRDVRARLAPTLVASVPEGTSAPSYALFGTHVMGHARFRALAGAAAAGIRFPLLASPDPANADTAAFIREFRLRRRHPPDYTAFLTFDATRLLLEAVRRAGPNRARIRQALCDLSPWPGLAGPIHFDGTGCNTRANLPIATSPRYENEPTTP
jgi:branched-chain amino acid transport system substrate-binding protein